MSRPDIDPELRAFFQCHLAARDGRRCFYCRRNFKKSRLRRKTLDHYIPHWIWPGWDVDNLVLACERCNFAKGGALPWPLVWLLLATYTQDRWELTA